ncbi:UDP-2,3-diacylglucosamine diphosphatase [Paludisphaera rhizosphaerae]|uniref:UDP-2,3-diacylglucosamine diphosphatase n=1 Tax=Paludisphaera rhizosphaerae TaxID=2711216 RepID=UPI0013EAF563|nr:UDP-2,3-diacylglucosamine diphosphatase [Paludisphaera rhizosphaerae]
MSDYFLSDVHLRDDRPERGRRLVRFLQRLKPGEDRLLIAGDLCDFWMGSRKSSEELARDEALSRLAEFSRAGGSLSILPGNHDRWLVPFYESSLRATILTEPYEMESYGLRVHIVHGHLLGARRMWKAAMESREFFRAFGAIPSSMAKPLDDLLETRNRRGLEDDERRHLAVFRSYADSLNGVDLAVFGHVHRAVDEAGSPRMIVLGGWQARLSYLKIDADGAVFHVESGEVDEPTSTDSQRAEPSNVSP